MGAKPGGGHVWETRSNQFEQRKLGMAVENCEIMLDEEPRS